ncbi:unnamed protein product [Amoebophrya sp. A25]|nr:unnamed protein product [Amoebophrya sp. A25]|eukprot:GSA25T00026698001.1
MSQTSGSRSFITGDSSLETNTTGFNSCTPTSGRALSGGPAPVHVIQTPSSAATTCRQSNTSTTSASGHANSTSSSTSSFTPGAAASSLLSMFGLKSLDKSQQMVMSSRTYSDGTTTAGSSMMNSSKSFQSDMSGKEAHSNMVNANNGSGSEARKSQQVQVAQKQITERMDTKDILAAEPIDQAAMQRFQECREIASSMVLRFVNSPDELYELFEEVMPSGTRGSHVKAVIFARRRLDGKRVIIKLRNKSQSFKDLTELKEWVISMKFLYYLSGGQEQEHGAGRLKQVANMVDVLEDSSNFYACMEHVEGRDLFDYFLQEKIYARSYRLTLVRQLCRSLLTALGELQSRGLIHKDLKLENVVFDEVENFQTGEKLVCTPKLIDFDTVEVYEPGRRAFHVLGTDQYIAPESYAGYAVPASDMWAIGVICYTTLTGSFPFHQALFNDQPGENYVDHVAMQQVRRRMRIARIDWGSRAWSQDPLARDFVRRCFVCEPNRRIRLEEAWEHPWIKEGVEQGPPQ